MNTTDQLLVFLVKAIQTQTCLIAVDASARHYEDKDVMRAITPIIEIGHAEETEFARFLEHIS